MARLRFYLGTHMPHWLGLLDVPLFVSRTRMADRRSLPRARTRWALDSGGFTELQYFGEWTITPAAYVAFVRRCADQIGQLDWAAPMDWMCEQVVIDGGQVGPLRFVGTHLSVAEHQRRTVANYVQLRTLVPELRIVPVLQGQTPDDYRRCIDLYDAAGIDLTGEPVVGLGSVCRRQASREIAALIADLAAAGLRLHGFGVKTRGLGLYTAYLTSADSMAWSLRGRHIRPCAHSRQASEANCRHFALAWRTRVLRAGNHAQLDLLAELDQAA
jgi:hypothetical protein